MEETVNQQRLRELLLAYSEWLDADQHLIEAPDGDDRTHEDLANEFLDEYGDVLPEFPGIFLEADGDG